MRLREWYQVRGKGPYPVAMFDTLEEAVEYHKGSLVDMIEHCVLGYAGMIYTYKVVPSGKGWDSADLLRMSQA